MGFLDKNFLMKSELARSLFNRYCKDLPIYDYHCHLSSEDIYNDKPFNNLYEVWLKGDHYKWRLMRFNGIREDKITGDVDPYECFVSYVKSVERAIDNPLYHWSHLELKRCFNIDEVINTENMDIIWNKANDYITKNQYSPRKAIREFKVDTIITTDEASATLEYHRLIANDKNFKTRVLPAMRADKIVNLDQLAIKKLGEVTGGDIFDLSDMQQRLINQINMFDKAGAVVSDMAFEGFYYCPCDYEVASKVYNKAAANEKLSIQDIDHFKTYMMLFLMREYYGKDWAVQLHIGAKRNNNTALYNRLGADVGADSISDNNYIEGINRLFDQLSSEKILGKTICYNLNPTDNYQLLTTLGNFANDKARMQMGIAWWFNDNKYGIERMMKDYASLSHFGNFLGMLTDSRSFISYTRHEFFRRLLCNYVASLVEDGEYPNDIKLLGELVQNISFGNAIHYFTK